MVAHKCIEDRCADLRDRSKRDVFIVGAAEKCLLTFGADDALERLWERHVDIHVILGAHDF